MENRVATLESQVDRLSKLVDVLVAQNAALIAVVRTCADRLADDPAFVTKVSAELALREEKRLLAHVSRAAIERFREMLMQLLPARIHHLVP